MVDLEKLKDLLDNWSVGEVRELLAYVASDEGFLDYIKDEYDVEPDEDWDNDDNSLDDYDDEEDYDDEDYEDYEEDESYEASTPRVHLSDEEAELADKIIEDIDNQRYTISAIENLYPSHIIAYIKDYVD